MKEIICPVTKTTYFVIYEANGDGFLHRKKDNKKTARYIASSRETQVFSQGQWIRFADGDELENAFLTGFHYVYALVHPKTKIPFYIGKGFQNRATDHFCTGVTAEEVHDDMDSTTKRGLIKDLLVQGYELKDIVRTVARHVDEKSAFDIEALLVHHVYNATELTNIQSGHEKANFRPFGNWQHISGFDLQLDADGNFIDVPIGRQKQHYIYVLVDPDNDDLPFYIGKGSGLRLQQHFTDAKKNNKSSAKLTKIRELLKAGYRANDIGKVIAYTSSPLSSFMMESFYLKFVLGNEKHVTNEVLGHYQQNFRAKNDWALRRGFDLRIVVEKGAKRYDLEDIFLGLQLDTILEDVKTELFNLPEKYKLEFSAPKVADAGELAINAVIKSRFTLKIFARPSRKVQVEIRPKGKSTNEFFNNIVNAPGVQRGDGVFLPKVWLRKPTPDIKEAAKRAALLIDLMRIESDEELTPELAELVQKN